MSTESVINGGFKTTQYIEAEKNQLTGLPLSSRLNLQCIKVIKAYANIPAGFTVDTPLLLTGVDGLPVTLSSNESIISMGVRLNLENSDSVIMTLARDSVSVVDRVLTPSAIGNVQNIIQFIVAPNINSVFFLGNGAIGTSVDKQNLVVYTDTTLTNTVPKLLCVNLVILNI
jgi:hypothetical protein